MKGDFTRFTFDPKKHYSSVRMQQGRVQLDADWNEQNSILQYRIETEAADLIGGCGGPLHDAGFQISLSDEEVLAGGRILPERRVPAAAVPGELYISAGRYYVGGILCENEQSLAFSEQKDYPAYRKKSKITLTTAGAEAVPAPVELPAPKGMYLAYLDVWKRHITALEDDTIREVALGGPDTATREQTLWQVKLHFIEESDPNCIGAIPSWDKAIAPGTGKIAALTSLAPESNDPCIVAPDAGYRRLENQLYRLEVHEGGTRNESLFKWSRDNGCYAAKWESQNAATDEVTVSTIGKDDVSRFASGQWLELTDDAHDLLNVPGTLVQIVRVVGQVITIDLATKTGPVEKGHFTSNPKVRRWDGIIVHPTNSDPVNLEDGVQVKLYAGSYKPGDHWQIPARTATASIEWPCELDASGKPVKSKPIPQLPHGIMHRYCRLAILRSDGEKWISATDCRRLFPPVTELTSLFYIGGTGQETMPSKPDLPLPLQVGVSNGSNPVKGARVKFIVTKGSGLLTGLTTGGETITDEHGIADCKWKLDPTTLVQEVTATLLNANGDPVHLAVHFSANLSIASEVAYNSGECKGLSGKTTVQSAIEQLAGMTRLYKMSGDSQHGIAGQELQVLRVLVANACGPVAKAKVGFKVISGGGTLAAPTFMTDTDGIAECKWTLGNESPYQEVEAELQSTDTPIAEPARLRFDAYLAAQSSNDPAPVHVIDLRFAGGDRLANDMSVGLPVLEEGIEILCDHRLLESTLTDGIEVNGIIQRGAPNCFVTAEIPFPVHSQDIDQWDIAQIAGFNPFILLAAVTVSNSGASGPTRADQGVIHWKPMPGAMQYLARVFTNLAKMKPPLNKLLLRLTLKGNYILSQDAPQMLKKKTLGGYLDGDVFGIPDAIEPSGLSLPSGDGRRGGDFEMWFWIEPRRRQAITVTPGSLSFGTIAVNSVKDLIINLTNAGTAPVTIEAMTIAQKEFAVIAPRQFPLTLSPGSIDSTVRFSPSAAAAFSSQLIIQINDAEGGSIAVPLSGSGQPGIRPAIELTRLTSLTPDHIAKLRGANIQSANDLARMTSAQLARLLGVPNQQAQSLIDQARSLVGPEG